MLGPLRLKDAYKSKWNENYAFRTYLKSNADSKTFDEQVLALHNSLFSTYNCKNCRNCCKKYEATFEEDEIISASKFLEMTPDSFKEQFIIDCFGEYQLNSKPCVFLLEDNSCRIESCKPSSCKMYPYTNQAGRLDCTLSLIESSKVCPVVYEIIERLKKIYDFNAQN